MKNAYKCDGWMSILHTVGLSAIDINSYSVSESFDTVEISASCYRSPYSTVLISMQYC